MESIYTILMNLENIFFKKNIAFSSMRYREINSSYKEVLTRMITEKDKSWEILHD